MNYMCIPGLQFGTSPIKKINSIPFTNEEKADRILKFVCAHFNLSKEKICSKTRRREISYPRQIAMHLMTKTTSLPLMDIGNYFGGKDHTTVIYARDHIQDLQKVDHDVKKDLEYIRNKI